MNRRDFISASAMGSIALGVGSKTAIAVEKLGATAIAPDHRSPLEIAHDESYWKQRRREFGPAADFINLEYGYFCPAALPTLETEIAGSREINARGSYYMRRDMHEELEQAREDLAALAGVSTGEVCITRNTTESLNIAIQGIDLAAGEEIVYSDQDYGSMVEALKQKSKRFGVVLKKVAIPLHPESDEEIVGVFEEAITPKTRLLHVTHLINLSGQVLPVRKICDMAQSHGVETIVDSAHAFAHVDYKIPDLNCDYLGSSLHKWLCAPVGLGLLYVRKEKIAKLWGLMGDTVREDDDIRKLERLGTRPYNHHRGMREAIRYHNAIGSTAKYERLKYLNTYWTSRFRDHERVYLNTPKDPNRYGAIANVAIRGVDPKVLQDFLFDKYSIMTAGIPNHPVVKGVRITPGLPTPLRHLDLLSDALEDAATTL